ncbi:MULTISPECIES: phage tail fiber protein [Proteus]|uniref:phage tail fiber protein n=1 Tax=Proteus TaxID=583 RepID=UPI003F9D667A
MSGIIKHASPIIDINPDGTFIINDESEGATVTRVAQGEYFIEGAGSNSFIISFLREVILILNIPYCGLHLSYNKEPIRHTNKRGYHPNVLSKRIR